MTHSYSQRAVVVLCLLGVLSAVMSVLSVTLLLQLQSQQASLKETSSSSSGSGSGSTLIPDRVRTVLLPVSSVLCALSLCLHLSCLVICLLHGYFSAEVCRGEQDTGRGDWFLLESRAVRHVAVGLFCTAVSVYLAAMSIFLLLAFETETGLASAGVLSSGILILLVVLIHSLVKASRSAKYYQSDHLDTLFQNDNNSSGGSNMNVSRPCELKIGVDKPRMHRTQSHLQHQLSYSQCNSTRQREQYQQQQHYSTAAASQGYSSEKDGYSNNGSYPRMHRSGSTESGLLQTPTKPWNGVNNEMRSVLARKSGISTKDSTLV